jgi:hypothetical protein
VRRSLRAVLSETIPDGFAPATVALRELCSSLAGLLSGLLRDEFPREWGAESLDGTLADSVRRTGVTELELVGLAILSSDSVTPIRVRLSYRSTDGTLHLRADIGEPAPGGGMLRRPRGQGSTLEQLRRSATAAETMDWVYELTFDQPAG